MRSEDKIAELKSGAGSTVLEAYADRNGLALLLIHADRLSIPRVGKADLLAFAEQIRQWAGEPETVQGQIVCGFTWLGEERPMPGLAGQLGYTIQDQYVCVLDHTGARPDYVIVHRSKDDQVCLGPLISKIN